ncbi:hypothetical protein Tco_0902032 [Tanacetum coccineum]
MIELGLDVGIVVDDEVLLKLISMVEKNELVNELMISVVDTEYNVTEFDVPCMSNLTLSQISLATLQLLTREYTSSGRPGRTIHMRLCHELYIDLSSIGGWFSAPATIMCSSKVIKLAFLRSSPKHNLTSSYGSPSCALVKKYMTSEFAEALTP